MRFFQQKQTISRQDGFTLVEVLIVIAIFSIGILGAMTMQTGAIATNATANKGTLAIEYATDTMERLMQVGDRALDNKFGVDDDGDGTAADDNGDELQQTDGMDNDDDGIIDEADELEWHQLPEFAAGGPYTRGTNIPVDAYYASIFNLSWTIIDVDCDGTFPADAKRIDILVTWDRGTKSLPLSNIRANMF